MMVEQIRYILEDSGSKFCFVSNKKTNQDLETRRKDSEKHRTNRKNYLLMKTQFRKTIHVYV